MENIEVLDMVAVGLGNLTEYRLLVLLGNYHSLRLVEGTGFTPEYIVDANERLLYPAYYMTHLQVPVTNLVEEFNLWDKAKVVVDVKRFGSNILDSYYTFQKYHEEDKKVSEAITMKSNSLFVLDTTVEKSINRTSSIPKADRIAELDKLKKIPDSLKVFKKIRNEGFVVTEGELIGNYKYIYKVTENRDASINHGIIFAKFIEIMDMCELEYLCGGENVGLPKELASFLHIIERETYYYSNCFAGDTIECRMTLRMERCENRHLTGKKNEITPYLIYETFELYNKSTRSLLVIAKSKKLISIPILAVHLEEDIFRIVHKR